MSKNPSWIQFSDEAWGEAVGPSEYDKFLDSLDAPTLPIQSLEPLPDHDAPLLLTWIAEHLAELAADEQFRVIGPHGLTFHQHADKLMEVAHLDAARRSATGDLRDQLTRQHREAKQELDDFERSVKFQSALRYRLEAAGPAFDRISSATPENQAAALCQQQAAAQYEGLKALIAAPIGTQSQAVIIKQARHLGVQGAEPDTDGLVAWQAATLDSWPAIVAAHGQKPSGRAVLKWLKNNGPRNVFGCDHPNDRDSISWVGGDGVVRPLLLSSVQKRLSEWRRNGKISS